MGQYSPRFSEWEKRTRVAREAKAREDAARLKQERTDMAGLLEAAAANRAKTLFAAIHEALSPYFTKAAPFKGALAFYVATSGRSALRVFPEGAEPSGMLRFEADLAEITAAISRISRTEPATVKNALPPLSAGSSPRWRSGTFKSQKDVDGLVTLFRSAEQASYSRQFARAERLDDQH